MLSGDGMGTITGDAVEFYSLLEQQNRGSW